MSTAGYNESENVIKVLLQQTRNNSNRTMIFFSFSNGGCAISHLTMRSLLQSNNLVENIKGQIFDSCPIVPDEKSAATVEKAFSGVINFPPLQPIIRIFSSLMVSMVVKFNKDVQLFMKEMLESPIKTPQLFLFSKADELAPFEDVLNFAKKREERGVKVCYKLWETSPHVAHFKSHPQEYERIIDQFIDLCIFKNKSGQ